MPDREESLLSNRAAKLQRLRGNGIDPYPPRYHRTFDAATAAKTFEAVEAGRQPEDASMDVSIGGRITSMRVMGKAAFLDLQDGSGNLQVLMRQNNLGEGFGLLKDLDIGDHLGARGNLIRTRTGEITVDASQVTITSKGMRPLPEKFHGLRDTETRFRQRYLDLIANRDVMPVFALRSKVISGIRRFLDARGFLEVDTPILVPVAAGAHARPFVTHHNALDQQLYLRIATELYLKRLIIGGFDKVYELGRVFRNEGIDQDHNPEFTLLESYEAYADYNDVMCMVEEMVCSVALEVLGTAQVQYGDNTIDFTPPWKRVSLREEVQRCAGIDFQEFPDAAALEERIKELGIVADGRNSRGRLIDKLVSACVEPQLIQPTFLLDYPLDMSPLAKQSPDDPTMVERFEGFAAGMEIANAFTELNDPDEQRRRFMEQEALRGQVDEDLDRLDEDYLLALEHGMPPTGGLGIGIDRLTMLLTGQQSIREVILFPQLRER